MVSHPTYDPATLASHNLDSVENAWKKLNANPSRPAGQPRHRRRPLPPGLDLQAGHGRGRALDSGKYTEDSVDPRPGPPRPAADHDRPAQRLRPALRPRQQVHPDPRARDLLQHRFGGLGLKLGADALRTQAAKFGFGDVLRVPMPVSAQLGPRQPQPAADWPSRPSASTTCASPRCRWPWSRAAIANGGVVMSPYLVKTVRGSNLDVIDQHQPGADLGQAVTPEVAAQLTRMMETVVTSGTGTAAQIPGVSVAGKTGTAQQREGRRAARVVHLLRPRRRPQGRRGRGRRGRRQRRQRGVRWPGRRAHRPGRHQGGDRSMSPLTAPHAPVSGPPPRTHPTAPGHPGHRGPGRHGAWTTTGSRKGST